MSDSAGDIPSPAGSPRPARWLDRLSMLVVCAGVAAAIGAAATPIARSLEAGEPPPPEDLDPSHSPASARPASSSRGPIRGHDDHPQFLPDDDPPRLTELERFYAQRPGDFSSQGDRSEPSFPGTRSEPGLARTPLTLRDKADVLAKVTGRVQAGAKITLLVEKGEWALVAHRAPDGATMLGWTARSAILVP